MERLAPKEKTLALRTFLGRFGLAGDSEDRPVANGPGMLAQRRRALALIDDEPDYVPQDMAPLATQINRLNNQALVHYYEAEWQRQAP